MKDISTFKMLIRCCTPDLINNYKGYRGGKKAIKPNMKIFTNKISLKKFNEKKKTKKNRTYRSC